MTPAFEPKDPAFEQRVRASFDKQTFMATLGAQLDHVRPGDVSIRLPFAPGLAQQHGFLHAGAAAAVLDSACGYAALTLAPAKTAVLAVEFKINLLAPAVGEMFLAQGNVVRAGRTICVCHATLHADSSEDTRPLAIMQGTIMFLADREHLRD